MQPTDIFGRLGAEAAASRIGFEVLEQSALDASDTQREFRLSMGGNYL